MKIVFVDGGEIECSEIEFSGSNLTVDGYRSVSVDDVERIEEED